MLPAAQIWRRTIFDDLAVDPAEHPVLLTEPLGNPVANRERMTQIMFETFDVPLMYTIPQEVLPIYAAGRTTGCVLNCGEGVSKAVTLYESNIVSGSIKPLELGGHDLTSYLTTLLTEEREYASVLSRPKVREIKERLTYLALDFDQEMMTAAASSSVEKSYELPDGSAIVVGNERFRCPEALFQPTLIGKEQGGVHDCVYRSIATSMEMSKDLYANSVVSGGGSMCPGFAERLKKELTDHQRVPSTMKIKVVAPAERNYSSWIGGSILSSLSSFQEIWISKRDYDESGPSIVHKKCQPVE